MTDSPEDWAVFAIRLGSVDRDAADNFLEPRGRSGPMRLDFTMWVMKSPSGVVVFDTGFSEEAGRRRGRVLERRPREAVRLVGVDPHDVGYLVVSHLHYDHAGNLDDFPMATVLVQEDELAFTTGADMADDRLRHFFEVDDITNAVRHLHAGRLRAVQGNLTLAPGIELHVIGGHTRGLQVVRVHTARGWLVLAADAAHYRANLIERNPFPAVLDLPRMLAGFDLLERLADGPAHVIPGHDPAVFVDYHDPQLPGGVVALHVEPHLPAEAH